MNIFLSMTLLTDSSIFSKFAYAQKGPFSNYFYTLVTHRPKQAGGCSLLSCNNIGDHLSANPMYFLIVYSVLLYECGLCSVM
ncbi:hypothetical protein GDO78_008840 [Eleutherodactylus coqui]|uniref:Uncharacterized protein n=1 Tax=Eleutherodactylus coqui TaxID=57060 RepID=A0A8J6K9Q8_ELECQ|nr:hypothetical protein GDO78_008840 [Eleutherodactylus coqui]